MPKVFGNLPTYNANQVTNSIVSLQATAVGMSARSFDCALGVHGPSLSAFRVLTNRSVPARLRLMISDWVVDSAPFPGLFVRRRVRDFYQRDGLLKRRLDLRGPTVDLLRTKLVFVDTRMNPYGLNVAVDDGTNSGGRACERATCSVSRSSPHSPLRRPAASYAEPRNVELSCLANLCACAATVQQPG